MDVFVRRSSVETEKGPELQAEIQRVNLCQPTAAGCVLLWEIMEATRLEWTAYQTTVLEFHELRQGGVTVMC